MGENEEYLDSLLRQASTIDNPDSALSRVMDITRRVNEEKEKEKAVSEASGIDPSTVEIKSIDISSDKVEALSNSDVQENASGDIESVLSTADHITESLTKMNEDDLSSLLEMMDSVDSSKDSDAVADELEDMLNQSVSSDILSDSDVSDISEVQISADDILSSEPVTDFEDLSVPDISEDSLSGDNSEAEISANLMTEDTISMGADSGMEKKAEFLSSDDVSDLFAETEEPFPVQATASEEQAVNDNASQEAKLNNDNISAPVASDDGVADLFASDDGVADLFADEIAESNKNAESTGSDITASSDLGSDTAPSPQDATKPMSQDDIAALLASMGNSGSIEDNGSSEKEESVKGGAISDDDVSDLFDLFKDSDVSEDSADSDAAKNDDSSIDDLLSSDFSGEIDLSFGDGIKSIESDSETDLNALLEQMSEESDEKDTVAGIDDIETSDFSESDIEELLDKASDVEKTPPQEELEIDLSDIEAFESEFGIYDKNAPAADERESELEVDADSFDIDSLLSSKDEELAEDDIDSLLDAAMTESLEEDESAVTEEEPEEDSKKKRRKKKKKKKDKDDESEESSEEDKPKKKKGKLAKFFEFLSKEEEPEEDLLNAEPAEGDNEGVTGENKEILDELDKETDEKGKKKKKKSKKDKKKEKSEDSDENPDEESEGDGKKKKEKKPKKEKKERKPLALDVETGKPLSKRNVILIFILCLSILGGILLVINLIPPMLKKDQARKAFVREDYETTYQIFVGEELKGEDKVYFESSEIILKLQHKYDAYNAYRKMGMRMEALDQLLQAVSKYEVWAVAADAYGIRSKYDRVYSDILTALYNEFGLTESECKEINALPTDLEYTFKCYSVINGTEYIDYSQPVKEYTPEVKPEENLKDELAEEGN